MEKRSLPIIKAVIVGGGKGCRDLLLLFDEYKPRHAQFEILGVADINPQAPGLKLAAQKGIYVTQNYRDLIEHFPELNLIIELTGRDEILAELWKIKPKKANILDHNTAWLFWEIITLVRERNLCELRLHEAEMAHLYIELISHFAHELRNPLMVIGGLARRLSGIGEISTLQLKEYTKTIAKEVEKLEKLMYQLSKVVEPLKPSFSPVSLNDLVFETVQKFRKQHPGLKIDLVLDSEMPAIFADESLLRKAILELLKNAAEALEKKKERVFIKVETRLCYDGLAIIIEDTGEGMDKDLLRLATLPFYTKKPNHFGLGLYFVSKVASAHGGRFYLFSEKDKGTIAVIELPPRMVEKAPLI